MSSACQDAFMMLQDLYLLLNADYSLWLVNIADMNRCYGLDLMKTILVKYHKLFFNVSWLWLSSIGFCKSDCETSPIEPGNVIPREGAYLPFAHQAVLASVTVFVYDTHAQPSVTFIQSE